MSSRRSDLGLFLSEIGGIPMLTAEEEIIETKTYYQYRRLLLEETIDEAELRQIEAQAIKAKQRIIKANLRLAVTIGKRYQHQGLELIDLIQEGSIGIGRAVDTFDPTKGYKFSTYAYWWIRRHVIHAIQEKGKTIRIPVHVYEKVEKIRKTKAELINDLISPTIEQISSRIGSTPDKILKTIQWGNTTVLSSDVKIGKEENTALIDSIVSEGYPQDTIEADFNSSFVNTLIQSLQPIEQQVIELKFGIGQPQTYTTKEIGKILSITPIEARQIQNRAMRNIRRICQTNPVYKNPLVG
jgi:RNA polymerase sigma factor (sigma-70 family)